MSRLSFAQIRARIAQLHEQGQSRPLTAAELDEVERLDHNYCQRLRRLTAQIHHTRAKADRLEAELQEFTT